MRKALWVTLLGIVMGVLWMMATPPVYANHYTYLAQGANVGEFGLNGTHTWATKTWPIDSQTTYFCNGLGSFQATWDAIAEWEAAFSFPWDEFTDRCGPGQSMDIVDNIGWAGFPCGSGIVACVQTYWASDSVRAGYYLSYARIWINRTQFGFNYDGMRYTIAHEIGHVYGLHEAYLHDPLAACNSSIFSVMDGPVFNSGTVVGGCDATGPTGDDRNWAHEFYVMGLSWNQPQNLASYKVGTDRMDVYWDDASTAESGYQMYAYYWTGSYWYQYYNVFQTYNVAAGDPWQHTRLNRAFYRPIGGPVNWYIACMYLNSGVIGNRYWKCFPMQSLGSLPG